MRWLAPTTTTDPEAARSYLVSVHRSFVYEMGASETNAGGQRPADAAATAARPARANPYSRLAMDTMRGIREHSLAFSPGIVAYLKMLVMLGTIRHELAIEYDLRANVRRFFTRYMRQRALALADPRLATERLYEASDPDSPDAAVRGIHRIPGTVHRRGTVVAARHPPADEGDSRPAGAHRRRGAARRRSAVLRASPTPVTPGGCCRPASTTRRSITEGS